MSLDSLQMETRPPRGETVIFDSAQPDKSSERACRRKTCQIHRPGVLTIVQIRRPGATSCVEREQLRLRARCNAICRSSSSLPAAAVAAGQSWERAYAIKLEPPQGAGESSTPCKNTRAKRRPIGQPTDRRLDRSKSDARGSRRAAAALAADAQRRTSLRRGQRPTQSGAHTSSHTKSPITAATAAITR